MQRAASWIAEHTPIDIPGAPEVTAGHTLLSATRAGGA